MLVSTLRPVVLTGRRLKNRLLNLVDTPVIILVYHRVTKLLSDPQLLAISPENFRSHMKHLKSNFPIVRFEDDWSDVKRPAVAVTFDDGYADNLIEALPILEEVEIPATFFISTGNLGTMREYWWDELERIVMGGRTLPKNFTLEDKDFNRTWPTGTSLCRVALYSELHTLIKRLAPPRREDWLMQLRKWANVDEKGREAYRALSTNELQYLARSKWVTIGAHTVTHTPLSALSEEQQYDEIVSSRHELEKISKISVGVFSYPFGSKYDYNSISVRLCREAGFTKAASNFPGQAHRWTDPFQLPRQLVRNWELAIFRDRVKGFWVQ